LNSNSSFPLILVDEGIEPIRKMKSTLILSFVLLFSLLPHYQDELEDDDTVANFKAAFLFQFATSNNWQNSGDSPEFTIGVLGGTAVYEALVDKFSSKPIGSQNLVISTVEAPEDLEGIQLLYISKTFTKSKGATETQKWIKLLKDQSVLVVTDDPKGLSWGGVINFKVVDNRIRYEVNASEAKLHGVKIGSKIMSWAAQD